MIFNKCCVAVLEKLALYLCVVQGELQWGKNTKFWVKDLKKKTPETSKARQQIAFSCQLYTYVLLATK